MTFSVVILTLNEEKNISECLHSVRWADDVVVLDSFSTDRTVDMARSAGARVVQRAFDNFAAQRNFALDGIAFKHPWIFHLDADERFTEPLREECEAAIGEDRYSGFFVPSKLIFEGKWLRFSGLYPTYQTRLLKRGEVRFIQAGHGQRESEAKRGLGRLREPYLHYNFSKGAEDWYAKHRRYAEQEALETVISEQRRSMDWPGLCSLKDPIRRRRALKALASRLPFRAFLRFIYMFVFRLGFLDGWAGLKYCRMLAWYEGLIAQKVRALRLSAKTDTFNA